MGLADVVAVLRADTSDFTAKLGAASAEMDKLGTSGASNFEKLASVGGVATLAIGAGVAAVAVASVDLASKFQSTTTSIAANAGISNTAAKSIGDAFLNTAGTTMFSGQQMATAYATVAGQLGETQGKALSSSQALGVMKAAMDLAEGSGSDLGASTADLATTMQAFGIKAGGAATASDVLFNSSRLTGNTVDGVTQSFTKLHSTLGAVSPSLGDLGGLLVDMTNHGETGRKALSAVNTALNGMLAPTAAVKKSQDEMGLSVFTASGQFVGMGSLIGQLQPKLAGMTQEQQLATLKAIGFGTANKAMLSTIMAGPAAYDAATAAVSKTGAAHDAAAKQAQTLQHQLDLAKATAEDLATKFGEVLIPKLEQLGQIIEKVIGWFEKHKMASEALGIVVGGALVAAIVAYTITMAAAAVETIIAAAPIIALIAAVGLLVVAGLYLSSHWQQVWTDIKNWFNDALSFLRSGFGTLGILLLGPVAPLLLLALHWQQVWNDVKSVVTTVWSAISGVVMPAVTLLVAYIIAGFDVMKATVTAVFQIVVTIITAAWDVIKAVFTAAIAVINGIISAFAALFTGNWTALGNALTGIITAVWNLIQSIFSTAIAAVTGIIEAFISLFTSDWNALWSFASTAAQTAWDAITGIFTAAWSAIGGIVTGGISAVLGFLTALPGQAISALSSLGGLLLGWITEAWSNVTSGLSAAWGATASWLGGVAGMVISAIGSGLSVLFGWGSDLIHGIVSGIESAASGIGSALMSAITGAISSAKAALNSIPVIGSALGAIGLAAGGYVTQPTLAWVGEAGPEFVIPEAQMVANFAAGVSPLPTFAPGSASGPTPTSGATPGPATIVYFNPTYSIAGAADASSVAAWKTLMADHDAQLIRQLQAAR